MTQSNIKHTSQHIDNQSFDEEFQMRQTALVKYDDPNNPTAISRVNPATEEGQTAIVSAVQNITIPAPEGGATEEEQARELETLSEILSALRGIATARGIASDIRVTLLGGTTAVTGTLTGVTTVTTVTTVTNLSQIGAFQANTLVQSNQNLLAVMGNVNNVG